MIKAMGNQWSNQSKEGDGCACSAASASGPGLLPACWRDGGGAAAALAVRERRRRWPCASCACSAGCWVVRRARGCATAVPEKALLLVGEEGGRKGRDQT